MNVRSSYLALTHHLQNWKSLALIKHKHAKETQRYFFLETKEIESPLSLPSYDCFLYIDKEPSLFHDADLIQVTFFINLPNMRAVIKDLKDEILVKFEQNILVLATATALIKPNSITFVVCMAVPGKVTENCYKP